MGIKIGSVHFSHWLREKQVTTIKFTENFKFFPEKAEIFLLFISLFNELEITNYFIDKECLLVVNEESVNVKVYVTRDICVLVAIDLTEEITPITVEIGDQTMIDDFEDTEKSKDVAKTKAEKLIKKEKEKVKASKDEQGRQAVFGDTVTGTVKD
jgi:hypothetical protein